MIQRKVWGVIKGRKILTEFFSNKREAEITAALKKARAARLLVRVTEVRKS
jgi:hypothetical protein